MAKPFVTWTVEGKDYKLVLEGQQIVELEDKLGGRNLMSVIGDNNTGIPSLKTMMLVTQASMARFNHGMKLTDVYALYDKYIEEGGSMVDFYTDVYVKIFQVSGFFPKEQENETDET